MEINYDLLPKQKTQKHNLGVEIDLYPYATELYEELDKMGIIERIKEIPQLGVIKVKKKLAKTRFDYVMLQLYLHKLIKNRLQKLDCTDVNYYNDLFINKFSILNQVHTHKRDYVQSQILKLTFTSEQRVISEPLLYELEKINNTRVGYYDRHSGEQTILVSIKRNCNSDDKRYAAYKTLKCTVNYLRRISNISSCDSRFLLAVKFFLFYLFDENPVVIKPTINRDICVVCTRGKNTRIKELQSLLKSSIGNEDENHEVKFLLSQIINDSINDTTITIPASIIVYQKDAVGRKLSEFDGLIIHPMRKSNQVIFLEAKNRDKKPSFGKKCLIEKFDKFSFKYVPDSIKVVDHDAFWKYSIK